MCEQNEAPKAESLHYRNSAPANIVCPDLRVDTLKWASDEETHESLSVLYQYVEAYASRTIDWYARHKGSKAWMSRSLRLCAIVLTTWAD